MSLFRFNLSQNLSPIKDAKDKKNESKSKLEKEDSFLKNILDKHPSGFSIEEIIDAEIPNGSDEEKRDLKENLLEFLTKISEKKHKNYEVDLSHKKRNDEVLEILNKLKEIKFDELKEVLTNNYIEICKNDYEASNEKEKEYSYFVGIACNNLAKIYFKSLNIIPKEKELLEIKNKFKDFYYNKNKKNIPPSDLKNFYEIDKE
ncbi:MAG: hypothetical protein KBD12_01770 [Candidatus Pacebacteria bacterium]|nr:hypothetical protein [Candidatus Paceibacterota bacterium]